MTTEEQSLQRMLCRDLPTELPIEILCLRVEVARDIILANEEPQQQELWAEK